MKKLMFILLFILSFTANAAKITDDTLKVGKPGSIADKVINLGDEVIIKNNKTTGKAEFSEDGGNNFKRFGTGSGGGGGENYNNGFGTDDNANAESGTDGWTASGGTFAVTLVDPIEGDASFTWVPSAQNDTLDGPVLSFDKDIFRGNSCQAQIEYIGGDENLTLQVIDGNNDVIGSQQLVAHTVFSSESAFFLCPSQADITGDANKGNLRFRLLNEGAVASALIKFDKNYNGTLRGLVETTLPDTQSARVDILGTLISQNGDLFSSCSKTATGKYTCNFTHSTSEIRSCTGSTNRGNINRYFDVTTTLAAVSVNTWNSSDVSQDEYFTVTCTKQGADAKQSVQVYKSAPKVSQNINKFGADLTGSTGTINSQNVSWIQSIASGGTGSYNVVYVPNTFDATPFCQVTPLNSGAVFQVSYTSSSSSGITLKVRDSGGTNVDTRLILNCVRGTDIRTGLTQNISLAGIVVNSYAESSQKQRRSESCLINSNATTALPSCDSWIQSVSVNGNSEYTVTFVPGIFSGNVECDANITANFTSGNTVAIAHPYGFTSSGLQYETRVLIGGATSFGNQTVVLSCRGDK